MSKEWGPPQRGRISVILIVLAGLCAALLTIVTGVAKDQFRIWIEAQPWYSPTLVWVLLISLVSASVGIAIWQYRLVRNTQQPGPAVADPHERRNRRQMIARVRHDWIDGILKQSLYGVVRIDLRLEDRPDLVDNSLTRIVQEAQQTPRRLPPQTKISTVFESHAGALLILGAPGVGKTTVLLELARDLLNRAEQDVEYPVPAVFNLSSWAVHRGPLANWLVDELNQRYDVPRKLAQHWVANEQILPLLDSLDEVAFEHREACADAINQFRTEHFLPIAVCSRTEGLSSRLRLPTAVLVEPLTRLQTEECLDRTGDRLIGLRVALEYDPLLWDLLDTPLMLNIAMLAYEVPVSAPV